MTEDEGEDDSYLRMLAGIGDVTMNSGHATMALQQFAATLTGTGLVHFMLGDAPLGIQIKSVEPMVRYANTNEWIEHPSIDTGMQDAALAAIKHMKGLVEKRNRVVHDIWRPDPTDKWPDGISGHRATRWGKAEIHTSIGTLHILGSTFFLAACVLSSAQLGVAQLRHRTEEEVRGLYDSGPREAESYLKQLNERMADIDRGRLKSWRWEVEALPKAPTA